MSEQSEGRPSSWVLGPFGVHEVDERLRDYYDTHDTVTGHFIDEPTPDILDTIDNALGCQRCGRPLGASPSDDFCSPECLRAWHARNTVALDPSSPDAARVYVGQDGRPVPLDEDGPEGGDPWQPFDVPEGVDWGRAIAATMRDMPGYWPWRDDAIDAARYALDAFQARQVTVEVNEHTNTAVVHVEPRPDGWQPTSWRQLRARLWNRITGERHD